MSCASPCPKGRFFLSKISVGVALGIAPVSQAATLHVPADYPAIQLVLPRRMPLPGLRGLIRRCSWLGGTDKQVLHSLM